MANDDTSSAQPRLTPLEDAELRQLTWFGLAGAISDESQHRIAELRSRDRRSEVRDPRPDPISQDSDGRRYISDADSVLDSPPDAHPDGAVSCSNCGYTPIELGSLCPHCAVRAVRSA